MFVLSFRGVAAVTAPALAVTGFLALPAAAAARTGGS